MDMPERKQIRPARQGEAAFGVPPSGGADRVNAELRTQNDHPARVLFERSVSPFDASALTSTLHRQKDRPIREGLQAHRIEREMLRVGLAVLESGPDQAGRSRDPVTGRPFVYLAKPGGFELQSAFQSKGKPVTMRFDLPK